ncbi:MAG: hypothetical protein KAT00_00370 [Planctomycetes bacterium]|nr:hypothetical protein [Planctomycetota bacterium]
MSRIEKPELVIAVYPFPWDWNLSFDAWKFGIEFEVGPLYFEFVWVPTEKVADEYIEDLRRDPQG